MVERVLVVGPRDTLSMVDDLAPKGYEIVKALHNSPEQKAALPGTHYFVGFIQQYVTPQLYKDAPNLKLVQMLSAGYDRADLEAARASGVPLCANGGANSVAVSEHAMLLMLAVSLFMLWYGIQLCIGTWGQSIPELPWMPVGFTYLPVPVGGAVTALFVLEHILLGDQRHNAVVTFDHEPAQAEANAEGVA